VRMSTDRRLPTGTVRVPVLQHWLHAPRVRDVLYTYCTVCKYYFCYSELSHFRVRAGKGRTARCHVNEMMTNDARFQHKLAYIISKRVFRFCTHSSPDNEEKYSVLVDLRMISSYVQSEPAGAGASTVGSPGNWEQSIRRSRKMMTTTKTIDKWKGRNCYHYSTGK
jgi:hypothetical protein